MRRLKNYLQHCFNPVHVYCRLMDFGVAESRARKVSWAYERYIYTIWRAC